MKIQQTRINAGLCPNCGKEAAPYYLCPDCRGLKSLGGMLNRGEKYHIFTSERRGRTKLWRTGSYQGNRPPSEVMGSKPMPLWGEGKGGDDKRLRPRVGKIPVNVEKELMGILLRLGAPATCEEIMGAWGKLRVRRGRASAACDLAALIKAERRRERRNRKRLYKQAAA